MKSKVYSTIVISSILGFALIAATEISTTAFVNTFAQEGFQTEDLINETIDMVNNTTTSNATLAFAQGEESEDIGGMTEDGETDMTDGLGNDTGGMSEGQTDPNSEGTDLGTGG
ncbi:MAG: hypothetical protein ACRD7F_07825, partial [Nitrososphaeraceae archaeon]